MGPPMTACPRCGGPMERGFLGAEVWPVGLQWYRKESGFGAFGGEPVATTRQFQMEYLEGERCPACRVMLLAY